MRASEVRLKTKSLNWALNSAQNYADTSGFPIPFEYAAIRKDWAKIRAFLQTQNILAWDTRSARSLLSPKSRFGFRVITQLDPLDFLVFASLMYEIGEDIENRRIPVADRTVFSYRFSPDTDGRMFDPDTGYSAYLSRSDELCRAGRYGYVTMADIADFYPRIYHHRLENALDGATRKQYHVRAIQRLLYGWTSREWYGIPVGNDPARLLAEITVSDVDEALRANGIDFVRYNDDYRLFAKSQKVAYKQLSLLAETLFSNHGLHLQPQKTRVLPVRDFLKRFSGDPKQREVESLEEQFQQLVAEIGLESEYEDIELEDLDESQQELIASMNLEGLFSRELEKQDTADLSLLRFILRRMGQLKSSVLIPPIFQNLETLHPLFPEIIEYLRSCNLTNRRRKQIGKQLMEALTQSFLGELQHHRMWALSLFTENKEWNNENEFISLLNAFPDQFSRRKLVLALGRSRQIHWFQAKRRTLFDEPAWVRRALFARASCMPSDARTHWYSALKPKLDVLENAVVNWARAHPFSN
jgi:hypothetical protein